MEARTDAASLSLYIQVTFVTFSRLIVRPLRVRVLMRRRRPRSRRCLKTHNTACCPHQQVAEGLVGWRACQRTHRWPAKQIFPFSTQQRDPHPRVSLCARQTGLLALVRGGDQYLMAHRSRCWNACFTFLHQSLLSHTSPARCSSTAGSLECEMGKERTGGAWKRTDGNKGILKPARFYDRDWT